MSDEQLSALISDIYDAALDPSLWLGVLEKATNFIGGRAAGLYSKDSVSKTANVDYNFGVDPQYVRSYVEKYVRIDPSTPSLFFFSVEEIISTADFMPYDEFLETRFYKEWVQPQGWADVATSLLEKSTTGYAAVSIFRHERDGLVDDGVRRRMRLLVPHLRRAMLIGKMIDLNRMEAATLADTLDGLAAGVFLVDAEGHLIHANVSGHVMLAEESFLRGVGGRMIASDPAADQILREAFAATGSGNPSPGGQGTTVPLPASDKQCYLAHILPLTSGTRRKAGAGYAAASAVFVRKAQVETPAAPEVIAKHYGLTPSELRVLLAVFESGGVSDIAEMLGISESTAKTHLRRLFEKTGTKRQSDLVKVVAGFAGRG